MIVKKGIDIKLYPNKAQKVFFAKTFGCCRFVYNQCLRIKSYIYEETKMSFQPKLKSFKEELKEIVQQKKEDFRKILIKAINSKKHQENLVESFLASMVDNCSYVDRACVNIEFKHNSRC